MAGGDDMPTLAGLRRGKTRRGATSGAAPRLFESRGLFDAPSDEQDIAPAQEKQVVSAPVEERAPALAEPRVWSVAALVQNVRGLVERSYGQVTVEGEISNWRPAASGHCYFTLKDGDAQLSIVMFRRQVQLMRFKPKDGDAVRLRGQLSVYESRGQMQLIAETMEQVGLGALLAAVKELKEKLRREGLFENKRSLPEFPRCIGVVTSTQGAALRDIVKVCRRRHAAVRLLVYPAAVQGPNCATEVAAGVRWFSTHASMADVVLVTRGGGSWEDLHGFDAEIVARAIADCSIPVITGIGHAVDSTIADAAADVCAPTPSAAAELVTASQFGLSERVERLGARLHRAVRFELISSGQRFARLSAEVVLSRVRDGLGRREQKLDELVYRGESAVLRHMRLKREQITRLESRVRQQHAALRLAKDESRLQAAIMRLAAARLVSVAEGRTRWQRVSTQLEALSPLRVLERGYALVYGPNGKLLRSASEVDAGDGVTAQLAQGRVHATVTGKE
jgi:exodeoxyribonuclease VII large subunit